MKYHGDADPIREYDVRGFSRMWCGRSWLTWNLLSPLKCLHHRWEYWWRHDNYNHIHVVNVALALMAYLTKRLTKLRPCNFCHQKKPSFLDDQSSSWSACLGYSENRMPRFASLNVLPVIGFCYFTQQQNSSLPSSLLSTRLSMSPGVILFLSPWSTKVRTGVGDIDKIKANQICRPEEGWSSLFVARRMG